MKKNASWKQTAELIGIAAIVASLIFVGFEIRQDQTIARAELATGTFDHYIGIDEALREPDFSSVFVKALTDAKSLTDEEMTRMNAFLDRVVRMWQRENYLRALGIFQESDRVVRQLAPGIFGNEYAQAWWKSSQSRFSSGIVERLSPTIESVPTDTSIRYLQEIRDKLE